MSAAHQPPRRKRIREWFQPLHLTFGLLSGLVVMIISLTGCIYVFESELQDLVYPFRKVTPQTRPYLPPSELRAKAEHALGHPLDTLEYRGPERAVEGQASDDEPLYYERIYLDPYSGEVLAQQNMYQEFFDTNLRLHMYLLLPDSIGTHVIGVSVIIFIFMLVSGIVLWWPRSRKRWHEAFRIKWPATRPRLNYDLHSVFGFYAAWIVLCSALTGLTFAYEWAEHSLQWAAHGGQWPAPYKSPKSVPGAPEQRPSALDAAFADSLKAAPDFGRILIDFPGKPKTSLVMHVYPDRHLQYNRSARYYDQFSGRLLARRVARSRGEHLEWMTYDIHVGKLLGLPGQILVFCAGLTAASLPVTGFMMWWSRRRRVRQRLSS